MTPEELVEALPAHNPRYVAYSYCFKHDDGRTSYPLIFIYFSPLGNANTYIEAENNLMSLPATQYDPAVFVVMLMFGIDFGLTLHRL